jgi:hypothetical protein
LFGVYCLWFVVCGLWFIVCCWNFSPFLNLIPFSRFFWVYRLVLNGFSRYYFCIKVKLYLHSHFLYFNRPRLETGTNSGTKCLHLEHIERIEPLKPCSSHRLETGANSGTKCQPFEPIEQIEPFEPPNLSNFTNLLNVLSLF